MKDLFIMVGCPGAGKSSYLKETVKGKPNTVIISRDVIRFSLLQSGEEYFSHENEVCDILWHKINEALDEGKDVFVDQTSLTPGSRRKLINKIRNYNKLYAIWIDADVETCVARNETRKGTMSYVPEETLRKMHKILIPPTFKEGFNTIFHYDSVENYLSYASSI